ncbi:TraB/VirB10 family protein [Pseudoduganella umbonata]|uniref:Conjugal transfer pilus assembly protein TraB n=1 Tax=Pseudoduganella umbonata TaxID=864828 RepID=A0A4P8HHU5_9BURK|nr:TraB/VirB10 family protein [Pseudoduganella umbonata]MBB3221706.1 conjugal transfer pilus assembly protein TraB [Pseudoduganella umbonata]QCP09073.1 conjugal transfer protein TraB [Pseudoduganella umbonata]
MTEPSATQRARRRQIFTAIGVAGGLFGIASIGVLMTGSGGSEAPAPADIRVRSYIAPGENVAPEDAWRGVSDSRLNSIEDKLEALEKKPRAADPPSDQPPSAATPGTIDLDARLREYERKAATYPPGRPSDPVAVANNSNPAPPADSHPPTNPPATGSVAPPLAPPRDIVTVRLRSPAALVQPAIAAGTPPRDGNQKQASERTTDTYLPAGMFGQAAFLSGLDAPTGGQSQSNPHPVLLELTDLAVLPNRYRYNWKHCRLIGAGYGDLSSERAYIRTETLSCVAEDGKVLDVSVKGFIVGEDGKAGMRGRVVSKQGQVLGNALLAGVVGGIGTGVERAANLQTVSPLGSTSAVKPGEEFQAAVGAGVGRSLDRLANYYIALAEKLFPVIEVDAGRVADVILTEGVTTDVQLTH